jgi:hypothetical protein
VSAPSRRERQTAHHEAGHAVAAAVLRARIAYVTIVPDQELGTLGACHMPGVLRREVCPLSPDYGRMVKVEPDWWPGWRMRNEIVVLLAGPAAELRFRGRLPVRYPGARALERVGSAGGFASAEGYELVDGDAAPATDHALSLAGCDGEQAGRILDEQWRRTRALITDRWGAVRAVAESLVAEQTLSGARVRRIVRLASGVTLHEAIT